MAVASTGLGLNLGGDISVKRFTFSYGNCVDAGANLTATLPLFTLKDESLVIGVRTKLRTVFAGTAVTAVSFTMGNPTTTTPVVAANLVKWGAAFDCMQAITATGPSVRITGPTLLTTTGRGYDEVVNLYVTAVGGNLNAMTAGVVTIDFYILNQTSPTTAGQ